MDFARILDNLVTLYESYYKVHRRTIALDKYQAMYSEGDSVLPQDVKIRESLLEHVGSLPVVATFLHPFLEHKSRVDLGRVLIMLAIHDIGETVVGDGHPHQKSDQFIESEYQAALKLLPEVHHNAYKEYEEGNTLESKFAKSVDVFATFLSDQVLPTEFVAKRLKLYGFSWEQIDEKRRKLFIWDSSLNGLFEAVVERNKGRGL